MSNELAMLDGGLPAHLKVAELDDTTKALMGDTGGGSKRISIEGGVWRLLINGKEVAIKEERSLNVVIVAASSKVSRTYYAGVYKKGQSGPPDCWSANGDFPDNSIAEPQAKSCASCPQNIKGSGQGDSRACRYEKRLAVVLADDIKGSVYQLLLPSKSYFGKGDLEHMPFEQYAKYVSSQGYNINMLVTEMKFDSDSDNPKLTFKPVGFLNKDQWEVAKTQGNTSEAKSAITMTAAHTDAKPKAIAVAAPAVKAEAVVEAPAADIPEPTKKATKKSAEEPTAKKDLASIMGQWATDDE